MAYTWDLVEQRFDDAQTYAEDSIEKANEYMEVLSGLLTSLEQPETSNIENIAIPSKAALDYGAIPDFNTVLDSFPTFSAMSLEDITLEDIPDITATVSSKNFNFIANNPDKPAISYGTAPEAPTLTSVTLPEMPSFTLPDSPVLADITIPTPPVINVAKFTATLDSFDVLNTPAEFNFVEGPYNSDIKVELFNKILTDIINGGTGLDVTVEQDIWDRYLSRQINENDRLYQEVQNQFAATGFGLPSGAYAARTLQVSSEISAKNDDANRDIAIKQAELAQNNTQFAVQQGVALENMLRGFFNEQQNRSLQSKQILASNAIELYNTLIAKQNLLLEKYKTEADVFEAKIRSELVVAEIYKAEVEGMRASVDVQQARVDLYNSQIGSIDILLKIYQTELDSAKTNIDLQNLQLTLFKTQTEAYLVGVQTEGVKADVYKTEVTAEGIRADAFKSEVGAYEAEVRGNLGVLESERLKAENKISQNQLLLDKYRVELDKYKVEIDSEIKTADLAVRGYQANVGAFQAQTAAKEMEFRTMISELSSQVEISRVNLQKALALIESETSSYVALKELAVKGTEGIMNTNAQLAASAMNAVNASASQQIRATSAENESHNHSYDHGEV